MMDTSETPRTPLPLAGVWVAEFGHTILGPSCGMILADLGAEVIKVEPPEGDRTRRLKGFGTGYFGFFNRNKRSLALDLKSAPGKAAALRLIRRADVLIENFAPGTMARLGLDYPAAAAVNPRLIYCSLKGFLPGPYEHRAALDEVVQMMSGLAYMTGPSGRPLRAGASVVDIMGGTFGALAIMAALRQRDADGRGRLVEASLFESAAFLMGQHLAYAALSDAPVPPMPERVSAWAVYDLFDTRDGEKLFVGITSDRQWERFCRVFQRPDLSADEGLRTNNARIAARPRLMPVLAGLFKALRLADAERLAGEADIAYARVARPEDLFEDPHLAASGGLMPTMLPGGVRTRLPKLPLRLDGAAPALRRDPPQIGEHGRAILAELGYADREIDDLVKP
jgi:crotonobetainyl-CoA:carnitine CoA-transferase CaiB-like acyl-CoA transferase